jgi:acyl-CoA thioesterase FadM
MAAPAPIRVLAREAMRVVWSDTDASGRIHNTAVFRWSEQVEHALMRSLGIADIGNFPRRHVEATFHRPLRDADLFELVLAVERLGRTSVAYAWRIERAGELCVEGRSIVVHVDADDRPAPLPPALRAVLDGSAVQPAAAQ